MSDLQEFMKHMNVMALVCGFEDDGSPLYLRENDTTKIHAIIKDKERYPFSPAVNH